MPLDQWQSFLTSIGEGMISEEIKQKLATTAAAKYPSCQKWH
jgi:hypothetical protein